MSKEIGIGWSVVTKEKAPRAPSILRTLHQKERGGAVQIAPVVENLTLDLTEEFLLYPRNHEAAEQGVFFERFDEFLAQQPFSSNLIIRINPHFSVVKGMARGKGMDETENDFKQIYAQDFLYKILQMIAQNGRAQNIIFDFGEIHNASVLLGVVPAISECKANLGLDLSGCNIDSLAIIVILNKLGNSHITEIDLSRNEVIGDSLESLVDRKSLKKITLRECRMNHSSAENVAGIMLTCPSLQEVDLSANELLPSDAKKIASSLLHTFITRFSIGSNAIKDDGVVAIANILKFTPTLRELDLFSVSMTDKGMNALCAALRSHPEVGEKCSLQKLSLSRNKIGVNGTKDLADVLNYTDLQSLELAGCFDEFGLEILAPALIANKTLRYLDLSENNGRTAGILAVAAVLRENHFLQELRLQKIEGNKSVTPVLFYELQQNQTLRKFDFALNNLDENESWHLAQALLNNQTLQELNLASCKIAEEGLPHLAYAIAQNQSLRHLDFRMPANNDDPANEYEDKKMLCYAEILRDNMALQSVKMKGSLTNRGTVDAFALALQNNSNLKYFRFEDECSNRDARERISAALKRNVTLQEVDIITDNPEIDLDEIVTVNNLVRQKLGIETKLSCPQAKKMWFDQNEMTKFEREAEIIAVEIRSKRAATESYPQAQRVVAPVAGSLQKAGNFQYSQTQ